MNDLLAGTHTEAMMKTYEIRTINDLLKVPSDKLDVCLREIQYSLELHKLAFGEECETIGLEVIRWCDDGKRRVELQDDKGEEIVTLRIIDAASAI